MRWFFLLCAILASTPATAGISVGHALAAPHCHDLVDRAGRMHSVCIGEANFFDDACMAIATFAWANELPQGFLARLIWLKGRNLADQGGANSSGVAQFLPGGETSAVRRDTFLPASALAYSADRVRQWRTSLGSLGLAAAAYIAGEAAVAQWTAGEAELSQSVRDYVEQVTGFPIETWRNNPASTIEEASTPFEDTCLGLARSNPVPVLTAVYGSWKPWGVLIAQHFTASVAIAQFDRAVVRFDTVLHEETILILTVQNRNFGSKRRHSAMIGRDSREEAEALCSRLRQAGGNCVVVRN